MKHIFHNTLIYFFPILVCACTSQTKDPKEGIFMSSYENEYTFVCVTLNIEQDTIVFCGDKESLYKYLHPNLSEYDFYKVCYNSNVNPITINLSQLTKLQEEGSIIYMNGLTRKILKDYDKNVEKKKMLVLNDLNNGKWLSDEMLLMIYVCWMHNIIITTYDETGPNQWFSYKIQ